MMSGQKVNESWSKTPTPLFTWGMQSKLNVIFGLVGVCGCFLVLSGLHYFRICSVSIEGVLFSFNEYKIAAVSDLALFHINL